MPRLDEAPATAEAIRELNERILAAEEAGRRADLEPLLTDDFWIVRASGAKQDWETFLAAVEGNSGLGRTADQHAVQLYAGCVVFTCRVTTQRAPNGGPGGQFWNTRLFLPHGDDWRCAAWQVTRISEA